jgi:hypothetical protein
VNGKLWLNSDILRTFVIYFVFSIPPIFAFPRLSGEFFCSDHKDTKNYPIDNQCIRFSLIIYDYPEIREELSTEITVDEFLCTVEYDYPKFHLTMHCYLCSLLTDALHLNEHEAALWLRKEELDSVMWLPADKFIIEQLKKQ